MSIPAGRIDRAAEVLARLLPCVQESIRITFGAIYGQQPALIEGGDEPPVHGVIGIISFVGDLPWSFMLALPRESALALTKHFAGFEIKFDSPDMADVVGELANVVAGDLVARLDDAGIRAEMSLPSVARGHDVEMLAPENQQSHRMRFTSEHGSFWIRVTTSAASESAIERRACCPTCGRAPSETGRPEPSGRWTSAPARGTV